MINLNRILAISCHADDAEIAAGGLLAGAVKKGHDVCVVIMTPSDYTNYDGKVLRSAEVALEEENAALNLLGVKNRIFLDFPTKDVPFHSTTIEALNAIIDDFKPSLILTHWSFDTHQAHQATALATISAARNQNNIIMYEPFPPSGRSYIAFKPQLYVDISETIDIKMESLKAHESQYKKYGKQWTDAVTGRAKMRGWECGKEWAESFEILRLEATL